MPQEQREGQKPKLFSFSSDVEWWIDSKVRHFGQILDLDEHGVYLDTPSPCLRDLYITMRFRMGQRFVEVPGQVVHRTETVAGMGVRFLELSPGEIANKDDICANG